MSISEIKKVLLIEKPDIIHAHDFTASVYAALLSKKIPVISHLHNNSPWLKKLSINSIIYGLSCVKYKSIITVSSSVFNDFIFGKLFRRKLKVLGNPISTEDIRKKAIEYEWKSKYDVAYCGRLSQPKNPMLFVSIIGELVKKNSNLRVVMVGDGELKNDVKEYIEKLNLDGTIEMLGFLDNPYPVIKNSTVLCMPSIWEGFGLAAVESLSLGVPVVCSGAGGLIDIVNDSCGDVCENITMYVDSINKYINDSSRHQIASKHAIKRSNELDNIEKYKTNMRTIYEQIWKGKK